MKDEYDYRVDAISSILDALPKLQAQLEEINEKLYKGGMTASEFRCLVSKRSVIIKTIHDLEKRAKEMYNMKIDQTKKDITFGGVAELMK